MKEPKYVCACRRGAWSLTTWPKEEPNKQMTIPFHCRSWRHEGDCRLWKGAQDFVRCKEALNSLNSWSHLVLTYDRQSARSLRYTFRQGVRLWAALRKRLIYYHGDIKYIQTWEIHRSGFPHVHLAVSNEKLYWASRFTKKDNPKMYGQLNFNDHVRLHAHAVGFGPVGWLEPLRSKVAMAGYLGKLARELTGKGKDYQVPTNAPKNFRRLRASAHLLPPILRNPDITGELNFCDEFGEVFQ